MGALDIQDALHARTISVHWFPFLIFFHPCPSDSHWYNFILQFHKKAILSFSTHPSHLGWHCCTSCFVSKSLNVQLPAGPLSSIPISLGQTVNRSDLCHNEAVNYTNTLGEYTNNYWLKSDFKHFCQALFCIFNPIPNYREETFYLTSISLIIFLWRNSM